MTDRPAPAVVAGDADSLDDLLARLIAVGGTGAPVDLVVPRGSSLLLTASEFRRLRDAVDRDRLGVTLRSDDPLRGQLAGLLGVAYGPIPPHVERALALRAAEKRDRAEAARPNPARKVAQVTGGDVGHDAAGLPGDRGIVARADGAVPGREAARAASGSVVGATGPDSAPARHPEAVDDDPRPGEPRPVAERPGAPLVPPPADGGDGAAAVADAGEPADPLLDAADGAWPRPPVRSPPQASPKRSRLFGRPAVRPPSSSRRGAAIANPVPAPAGVPGVGAGTTADDPAAAAPPDRPGLTIAEVAARREKRPTSRWLGLAVAGVVFLALVVGAGALLMPRATVAVTLERIPVRTEVVYDVGVGAAAADAGVIAVPATPVTVEVAIERTVPTTGRRLEPDGVAVAPVRFANPNPGPVTIEPNTVLGSLSGMDYVVVEAVEVPPADPATGAAGRAEGEVRAVEPGAVGNVGVGEIGGQLESGVYYSNRDRAADGGTDREVPVVAAADLAALSDAVAAAITEAALAEVEDGPPGGGQPLPGTVSIAAQDAVPSAAEGDAAETLSASATATVRLLAYDPDALTAAIGDRLPQLAAVPDGRVLDPTTVRFGAPIQESASAAGTRLRVPIEGDATVPFGPSERRALAERLANDDAAAAEALLGSLPGIEAWQVDYAPGWLPARMPGDPDRIEIEVAG